MQADLNNVLFRITHASNQLCDIFHIFPPNMIKKLFGKNTICWDKPMTPTFLTSFNF